MKKIQALVVMFTLVLALSHIATAQEVASLTGVVTDKTGAVIPQALVKLVDTKTNASFVTVSNGVGSYTFTKLLPGPDYTLTISKDGFRPVSIEKIYLGVDTTHTQNAQLEVGGTTEVMTVEGSGSQVSLNTTDTSVSSTIDMRSVQELPLALRDNPLGLLAYAPGVTVAIGGPTGQDNTLSSRDGAITGARTDQSNYTLDGMDANDFGTGETNTLIGEAPVDSVQEMRTETANPLAAEGRGSGAQVALVTKSGTNTWHGSAYDYNRTAATTANTFFNNRNGIARPPLTRNQFGASLGGPAIKNKLFFFFNYEGRRDAIADVVNTIVPLDNLRAGNVGYINNHAGCVFSSRQNTTPGCISFVPATDTSLDPAGIGPDPSLLSFLNSRYPHANDSTQGDGVNTGGFTWNAPEKYSSNDYVSRIDYNLNSKMKLFGRVSVYRKVNGDDANGIVPGAELFPGDPAPSNTVVDHSWAYVIGHTWSIGNNKVNQFNIGETRSVLDFPVLFNPTGTTQYNLVMATAFGGSRITSPVNNPAQQGRTIPIPVYRDDFTYVRGNHTLQVGGTFKPITDTSRLTSDFNLTTLGLGGTLLSLDGNPADGQVPSDLLVPSGTALRTFSEAYVFALGRIGPITSSYENAHDLQPLPQGSGHTRKYRYYETELYAQDSWRVRNDLTLSYGLRWEHYSVPYEMNGFQTAPNIDFASMYRARAAAAQAGISGDGVVPTVQYNFSGKANHAPGLFQPTWRDFAPRVGFSYSPSGGDSFFRRIFGDRKTVIRGGAGIVTDHTLLSAVNFFGDQTSFVFGQTVPTLPGGDLATDPRFGQVGGVGKLPPLTPPQPSSAPFTPFLVNGTTNQFNGLLGNSPEFAVDPHYKTPYSETLTFGIQRELPANFLVEVTYVGRMGHRLLSRSDAGQVVDFKDQASGESLVPSFANLSLQVRNKEPIVGAQFWENVINPTLLANPNFGGTCEDFGFASCAELVNDPTVAGALVPLGDMADTVETLYAEGIVPANVGLDPQFSAQLYFGNKSYSNYQGLLTSLHKKLSHGLQFDFNYTYSHSIDNNSTPANNATGTNLSQGFGGFLCDAIQLGSCRANSDFDVTHLISGVAIYDLPIGRGRQFGSNMSGWLNRIVGGWQLAGLTRWNTGFAFTTISQAFPVSFNANSPALFIGQRSDLKVNIHTDANGQVQLFADPVKAINAFTGPIGLQGPTRNNLRGPRFFNVDLSLNKRFAIYENLSMEFRAEAYNAFNHTNFALPTGGIADITNSNTFGVITSTAAPRVMQFSLRLDF